MRTVGRLASATVYDDRSELFIQTQLLQLLLRVPACRRSALWSRARDCGLPWRRARRQRV